MENERKQREKAWEEMFKLELITRNFRETEPLRNCNNCDFSKPFGGYTQSGYRCHKIDLPQLGDFIRGSPKGFRINPDVVCNQHVYQEGFDNTNTKKHTKEIENIKNKPNFTW